MRPQHFAAEYDQNVLLGAIHHRASMRPQHFAAEYSTIVKLHKIRGFGRVLRAVRAMAVHKTVLCR